MQKNYRSIYILMGLVLLFAGCTPSAPPTPSPEEIANQVATSVALTVQAQDEMATSAAQTKEAEMPTEEPAETEEPEPAATSTSLPTATTIVIVPTTGSGGGGSAPTQPEYACDVIHKRPYDNTVFRRNDPFDIRFTILNKGTKKWDAGKDLIFTGGTKLASAFATIELPEMDPGDTFDVGPYDAFAPAKRGSYIMAFKLEGLACQIYVAITVE